MAGDTKGYYSLTEENKAKVDTIRLDYNRSALEFLYNPHSSDTLYTSKEALDRALARDAAQIARLIPAPNDFKDVAGLSNDRMGKFNVRIDPAVLDGYTVGDLQIKEIREDYLAMYKILTGKELPEKTPRGMPDEVEKPRPQAQQLNDSERGRNR